MVIVTDTGKEKWSQQQQDNIKYYSTISGSISLFSMTVVVVLYIVLRRRSRMKHFWSKLLLHKFVCLYPLALMFALGPGWGLPFTDYGAFCKAQGFLIHLFSTANAMWGMFFGIQMSVLMIPERNLHDMKRSLWLIYPFVYLYPIVSSIVLVAIGSISFTGIWCWINLPHEKLRLGLMWVFPQAPGIIFAALGSATATFYDKGQHRLKCACLKPIKKKMTPEMEAAIYFRPFLISYIICWGVGTVLRVQSFFNHDEPVYALVVANAILTPGEGFFMALCFLAVTIGKVDLILHKRMEKREKKALEAKERKAREASDHPAGSEARESDTVSSANSDSLEEDSSATELEEAKSGSREAANS